MNRSRLEEENGGGSGMDTVDKTKTRDSDEKEDSECRRAEENSRTKASEEKSTQNLAKLLVHQTDASGKQERATDHRQEKRKSSETTTRENDALLVHRRGAFASLFLGIFGCCAVTDSSLTSSVSSRHGGGRRRRGGGGSFDAHRARKNAPREFREALLGEIPRGVEGAKKKTLALDLDETLVHSTFQDTPHADIVLPINIDGITYRVFVRKRPGATWFIDEMSKYFEVVVYTASLQKYADPLLDLIDKNRNLSARLFRRHCNLYNGGYVKDLSRLGRDMESVLLVDNSPLSYQFQPRNGVPCSSFIDDPKDTELYIMAPYLESLATVEDVRKHTFKWKAKFMALYHTKKKGPS